MISVHETEKLSLQQIEKFLAAAKEVRFEASERKQIYSWTERLLCQQEYMRQGRRARGLLRRYIGKMTGLSRSQVTRLVGRYAATGQVRMQNAARTPSGLESHTNPPSLAITPCRTAIARDMTSPILTPFKSVNSTLF
jgi:hypothetical protein